MSQITVWSPTIQTLPPVVRDRMGLLTILVDLCLCDFAHCSIIGLQLVLNNGLMVHYKILKLGLPHFHGNFQSHKRRGLCCSCRQQWGPRVMLSHLRTDKKQPCLLLDMYWGSKVAVFNVENISYCLSCVFCWICSSQTPSAPLLSGTYHHNTVEGFKVKMLLPVYVDM